MAAITDYASLTSTISDWAERTYTLGQTDQFIALAEAEFRLYFGPNFAKDDSVTLAFVAGSTALPDGFIRPISLVHETYGPLRQADIGTIRDRRIYDTSGVPDQFAVTGSTIEVASSYDGNLDLDFEGTLMGLSASNTTNWLISNAPQAYLSMCLSMEKARQEDFQSADTYRQAALRTLNDLGIQSTVAQVGRGSVHIPGMTP